MSEQERLAFSFGPFRLDVAERLLLRDGEPITLPPKAFETLLVLVQNSGRLITKRDLMNRLWPDTFVEEANLANNISLLRKVLDEIPAARDVQELDAAADRKRGHVSLERSLQERHLACIAPCLRCIRLGMGFGSVARRVKPVFLGAAQLLDQRIEIRRPSVAVNPRGQVAP